jgi:hypothetical protein
VGVPELVLTHLAGVVVSASFSTPAFSQQYFWKIFGLDKCNWDGRRTSSRDTIGVLGSIDRSEVCLWADDFVRQASRGTSSRIILEVRQA